MSVVGIPPLHVVTDDRVLAASEFRRSAAAVLHAGREGVALHLRGPRTSGRRLFQLASELVMEAQRTGAQVLVNDRVDVALGSGAQGAQLGGRSMTVADARALLGAGRLIGASVHSAEQADAMHGRPDFLLVGTLFPTASHPGHPGAGIALLGDLAGLGIPLVGIGGITAERLPALRSAGAAGAAAVRGIWDAPDPARAATEYLEQWHMSIA